MALEYFLYTTEHNNTLIERSDNSFAPLPPNTGEIYIDYFIPTSQPLFYYRESGATIVLNTEANINEYLQAIAPPPEPEDSVEYQTFTGYTDVIAPNTFLKLDQSTPQVVSGGTPQFDSIQFNTSTGLTYTHEVGKLHWHPDDKTLEVGLDFGVRLQIGQELVYDAYNESGSDILNGQLVNVIDNAVVSGTSVPTMELADATKNPRTLGMTTQDIPNNSFGFITSYGKVRDLNTSGISGGTVLYLGITPGSVTATPPPAPYYVIPIGVVLIEDAIDGVILVSPQFGYKISDMADVSRTGATTTGQILTWDSALEYYRNDRNINDYLLISEFSGFTGTTNLQTVTEIGSTTNIESTFSSGIITNRIKPTGDTVTGIQITKSDGTTAIINIDTVSGFTGFGTINPETLVHMYGTDTCNDTLLGLQTNGLRIDGVLGADKDIQWATDGVVHWLAQTYRCENGKFWYLYNQEGDVTPLAISDTGRIGVNSPNNIINKYAIADVNSGLDDIRFTGLYDKNFISIFQIEIDGVGTPDTFQWRVSYDEGHTFGAWSTGVPVSTGNTLLESGVYTYFLSETGHTIGNSWEKSVFPQLPQGTFTVHPNRFEEILLTDDYNAFVVNYQNYTGEFNSSREITGIPIFVSGDSIGAMYVASTTKLDNVYFNINEAGEDITLITEYWDGSAWVDIAIGNPNYYDDTHDLTVSGIVEWDSTILNDWIKGDIPDFEADDSYYWMRFRSSSNVTKQPLLNNIAAGGDKRFAVYGSPYDYKTAMYVDTRGRINIGGGNITGTNVLQINSAYNLEQDVAGINSLVEIDSNDSSVIDYKLKLSSNDALGGGLTIIKTRGTLDSLSGITTGDEIGHIDFRGRVSTGAAFFGRILSEYTGDGTTKYGDLIFKTTGGATPVERIRITGSGNTGFGISIPTAVIHLKAGDTTNAPLRFTSGALLTAPQAGAVEFLGDNYYGTTTGDTRKTFAFLESPEFTGAPELPVNTTLIGQSLCDFIWYSGGSCNPNLTTTTLFNAYTASTLSHLETSVSGASNGLSKADCHTIKLGGTLCENTTITGSTHNLTLSSKCLNLCAAENIDINSRGCEVNLRGNDINDVEKIRFMINACQIIVTDGTPVPTGIQYANDYSSTYSNRSLVDKEYVDNVSGGLNPLAAVAAATTGDTVLSGLIVVDGIQTTTGMRILVKDQTSGATNGVYSASTGTWGRTSDFDGTPSGDIVQNSLMAVLSGNTNALTTWILNTPNPITVDVTPLNFVLYSSSVGISAGNGICVTQSGGNKVVSVKLPAICSGLCADVSGLYLNPSVAGNGICLNNGVLSIDGAGVAGNSICWSGNSFNVDIASGTLSTALNSKLNSSIFNTYTGTTAPNTYYNKTEINAYTGATATLIGTKQNTITGAATTITTADLTINRALISNGSGKVAVSTVTSTELGYVAGVTSAIQTQLNLKAPLNSPALTGTPTTPTAAVNTSTTQIAATAFVINQASAANPLMNGTVAIGTSLRYSREDHVHPTDTSRFAVAGGTITGSVIINNNLNVSGTTTENTLRINSGLAKYNADYSGTYDNRTLVDKEFVDTHPLTYLNATSAGATTTTSTAYVLQTGMQITNVPAGTYLLSYGTWVGHGSANAQIYTEIYIGGVAQTGSEMMWSRGGNQGNTNGLMVYNNYVITLGATATVEIRWRTNTGTATSTNRYITLLKVNSLI